MLERVFSNVKNENRAMVCRALGARGPGSMLNHEPLVNQNGNQ